MTSERHDEWTDSAESEPVDWSHDHNCRICGRRWNCSDAKCAILFEPFGCGRNGCENEPTDAEMAEWAQALIEEEDEELNDPPVKCRICRAERPISQMNTNGECPPCQREVALMVKPEGKCVTLADNSGIEWKL